MNRVILIRDHCHVVVYQYASHLHKTTYVYLFSERPVKTIIR